MRLLVVKQCDVSCPFYEYEEDTDADEWEHACVHPFYFHDGKNVGGVSLPGWTGHVPAECPLLKSVSLVATR